ncbi:SHOCT domain-containing protein [Virgibacillus alimentarius]|uniref:Membrane protein n=1 Tax=Virgibacillus alimentarius TaxID=698769 RepID=A0ABS4SAC7_9BACI|nr:MULTISPECIES: SHOCT domain-containing protein [Virgibacillus]MBP2258463.1 putative membrane protein [Virgibacillus alimentarius]HLR67073.1 SHOCT domain-containing protein [Virgibacillus sp.]
MNNMDGSFFGITWLIITALVIISVIIILKNKKKPACSESICMINDRYRRGEITEEEYRTLLKKINE